MPIPTEGGLVVELSSRVLFNFEEESRLFEAGGDRLHVRLQFGGLGRPVSLGAANSLIPDRGRGAPTLTSITTASARPVIGFVQSQGGAGLRGASTED